MIDKADGEKSMNIVSFVILHYKDAEVTDACVQSILAMEQQERIRIVVVDNDIEEKDEKRRVLAERYKENPRIKVLPIHENGGFSYANNQGYAYARGVLKAAFVVVINNDILFTQKDFIEQLEKSYEKHKGQVMGPDVIRESTGEHQNPMDERIRTKAEAVETVKKNRFALKYYSLLYPMLYLNNKRLVKKQTEEKSGRKDYYGAVQRNKVLFGACLIFTPLFVEKETKAFEPETRFFYEEYLLTLRCQKKGYMTVYDPGLKVLHESGAATKRGFKSEKRRLKFTMKRVAEAAEIYAEMVEK